MKNKLRLHAIKQILAYRVVSVISRVLTPIEVFCVKRYKGEIKYPPIFMIGAPRTGSTILYEYITHYLDVVYINNLMCIFHRILYLGYVISRVVLRNKQHGCFDSENGSTSGLNSPSECGEFWYRWVPTDRHFVDFNELDNLQIAQIHDIVRSVVNASNKPIVFKNMNCGQRLRIIKDIFPNALFIYCKRDPLYTAQSLIEVREKVYKSRTKWWSIMPREYDELIKLDYPEQVVKQIYYIQKQIEEDLCLFARRQSIEVWYESFCESPKLTIERIRDFMLQNGIEATYRSEVIQRRANLSQQRRIDKATYDRLNEIINSLDW